MWKKLNFDYDEENDILSLYTKEEYKGSISLFGLTIDFAKNMNIKGVEIPQATKFFSELSEKKITSEDLKVISEPQLNVKAVGKMLYAQVDLKMNSESLIVPLTMDNPTYIPSY